MKFSDEVGGTDPNESQKERHDCERKANNHDDAEISVHVLARYELVSHRLNPSGSTRPHFRMNGVETLPVSMRVAGLRS